VDVQVWPPKDVLNPEGWLRNFLPAEEQVALRLLEGFTYFSGTLTNRLFVSAFHGLSSVMWRQAGGEPHEMWRRACDQMMVTYVEGEQPNPTDSGFAFARKARQLVGIEEDSILAPKDALAELRANPRRPLVIVDDFVGSGKQFVSTWTREHTVAPDVKLSFDEHARNVGGSFYYIPLVCSDIGSRLLSQRCPQVIVAPAHQLSRRDRALSTASRLWPPGMAEQARRVVETASVRAGIPLDGPYGWRGFWKLGLTIAFEGSVPDATLPIFYWEQNGWIPLIRKA